MALNYISSGIRSISLYEFIKECIINIWLDDSSMVSDYNANTILITSNTPLTIMGGIPLIYDETDLNYKLLVNVGPSYNTDCFGTLCGNVRYWYDTESGFAMITCNNVYSLRCFYTDTNGGLQGIKYWLPHMVTKIDEVSYLLPGEQNSTIKVAPSGNMIIAPFYCNTLTNGTYHHIQFSTNVPYISRSFATLGNDITLIPLRIGACIIPDMYVSVNNYALTDQIITDGINNYICLDSFLFRKIT